MPSDDPILFVRVVDAPDGGSRLTDRIMTFTFTDEDNKADLLRIEIDNRDLSFYDDELLRKGSVLAFGFGLGRRRSPVRSAVVTGIKGPIDRPVVEAKGMAVLMASRRRSRVFQNVTRSEVVSAIAAENGFADEFLHVTETTRRLASVTQANESDAALLSRLAARQGFVWYIDHTGLHWQERNLAQSPVRQIAFATGGGGDWIAPPVLENDVTVKPGRVRVESRDPVSKITTRSTADNQADDTRAGLGKIVEIVPPEGGATVEVDDKTIEDVGRTVRAVSRVGEQIVRGVLRVATLNPDLEIRVASDEVEAVPPGDDPPARARGRYRTVQRTAVKLSGSVYGDPLLTAKQVVECVGLGTRISGRYYVKQVVHQIGTGGYSTSVRLVSDGHGGHRTTGTSRFDLGRVAGRSGGTRRSSPDDLASALAVFAETARTAGPDALGVLRLAIRAANLYAEKGSAGLGEVRGVLRSAVTAARKFSVDKPGLSIAANRALAALSIATSTEQSSAARLNQGTVGDDEALEEIERIDPEGDTYVSFQPRGGGR